jgi:acetate---CoA ligase (ADP-forming)
MTIDTPAAGGAGLRPRAGTHPRSLVFPRSLAIIGASPRRPAPIENALRGDLPAWGVHPTRRNVLGLPCVAHLEELGEAPETAVVLVGHSRVEQAIRDALAAGVRNFVVPGLGNEAGLAGREIAARVLTLLQDADATMLGPNCMGTALPVGASTWLSNIPPTFVQGHVAAVVQSGSVGEALLAVGPRIGFRAVVSCGGELCASAADFTALFADDDQTRAVGLFVEAVRDPASFAAALAHCAANEKPVVCLKVGASAVAARTAFAHTGAIVGSRRAFSALLARYGALEVHDFAEWVEALEILGRKRWPRGTRTAAVCESGGEAALLADAGDRHGLEFSAVPPAVAQTLAARHPALVEALNPFDAWAIADPGEIYPSSLDLLAGCGAFDVVLAHVDLSRFRPQADQAWNEVIVKGIGSALTGRSAFGAVLTTHTADPPDWAYELARKLDLALLRGVHASAAALAQVATWVPRCPRDPAWGRAIAITDLVENPGPLPEHESSAILERYGVVFAARRRVGTADEAAQAAAELGPPVVVKADGPPHKARSGGVVLNVMSEDAAREAAVLLGGRVVVAKQVAGTGEAFCGMVRDAQYGPVLVVGKGGSSVEDGTPMAAVLGPIGFDDASRLVRQAGIVDPDGAIARAVEAIGRLAVEHEQVTEVDINPLVLREGGAVAVDALVVTCQECLSDE